MLQAISQSSGKGTCVPSALFQLSMKAFNDAVRDRMIRCGP